MNTLKISLLITIIFTIVWIFAEIVILKNEVTYKNRIKIIKAITDYEEDFAGFDHFVVSFLDMEDYDTTLWRLWDWSYKRILPPDKFELIEDYIKE